MGNRRCIRFVIIFCSLIAATMVGRLSLKLLFSELSVSYSKSIKSEVPVSNSPFDRYDFANCKIRLCGLYHYSENLYLSEKEISEFVEILLMADIYKYASPEVPGYNGEYDEYIIEFENGQTTSIYCFRSPWLMIGERTYKCYNEEALRLLEKLTKRIYGKFYPDEYSEPSE